MLRAVPAVHRAQDPIGTGLQGNMKMTRETIGGSHQRYKIFRDVLWLNRTEAQLLEIGSPRIRSTTSVSAARGIGRGHSSQVDAA